MDQAFPSELTHEQWNCIKHLLPKAKAFGRPRTTCLRTVINAVFYLNRTGNQWRYLPKNFPPWQTVYDYFAKWSKDGTWFKMNLILNKRLRHLLNRTKLPSFGIIDSQSVRAQYGDERGYDGFKKVRGRKRHIIVDTQGLVWACDAQSANLRDPHGGVEVLHKLPRSVLKTMKVILGDAAYVGPFDDIAHVYYKIKVERTKTYQQAGTTLKPKRWIVERTFAWLNYFRRTVRDYERRTVHSESVVYISMIQMTLMRMEKIRRKIIVLFYFPDRLRRRDSALSL